MELFTFAYHSSSFLNEGDYVSSAPKFTCCFDLDHDARICVVALKGSLDPVAVDDLHPQVQELYRSGYRKFAFDLADLEYIGSLGIRLVVGLSNQLKGEGTVALCNLTSNVRSVVELTRLDTVLKIYPNRADAVGALHDL